MIETILTFFALGTLGFWILVAVASILFIASVENDHFTLPTIVLIALGIAYSKPFVELALDWRVVAMAGVGYVIIGIGWSLYRWFNHVREEAESYRIKYGSCLNENNRNSLKYSISASNNKQKIIGWIAYWPWSMTWNIVGDFFTLIYDSMRLAYQKIADRELSKFGTQVDPKKQKTKNFVQ
jgi:hypothetical protein